MHSMINSSIEQLPELVNSDCQLVWRGRFFGKTFLFQADDSAYYVTIYQGRIEEIALGPVLLRPWCFAISASAQAWRKHWEMYPQPGWHDIFAMTKIGEARIEGELQPLMANLRYIKEVLAKPRTLKVEG